MTAGSAKVLRRPLGNTSGSWVARGIGNIDITSRQAIGGQGSIGC
jgi:hypothetical protein